MAIVDEDYPEIFRAADRAAARVQSRYIALRLTELGLLIIGAAVAGVSTAELIGKSWFAHLGMISGSSLTIALIVSVIARMSKQEESWNQCRTLAESVKKSTWLYIMCAPPYNGTIQEADSEYILTLDELHDSLGLAKAELAKSLGTSNPITDSMRNRRKKSWNDRRDLYRGNRLDLERSWYAIKAAKNSKQEEVFIFLVGLLEVGAIVFSIALFFGWTPFYNAVGLITTGATVLIAWSELRRHQQLSRTYSTTSQKLASQLALIRYIDNESALISFVGKVEDIISTENTDWSIIRS